MRLKTLDNVLDIIGRIGIAIAGVLVGSGVTLCTMSNELDEIQKRNEEKSETNA